MEEKGTVSSTGPGTKGVQGSNSGNADFRKYVRDVRKLNFPEEREGSWNFEWAWSREDLRRTCERKWFLGCAPRVGSRHQHKESGAGGTVGSLEWLRGNWAWWWTGKPSHSSNHDSPRNTPVPATGRHWEDPSNCRDAGLEMREGKPWYKHAYALLPMHLPGHIEPTMWSFGDADGRKEQKGTCLQDCAV